MTAKKKRSYNKENQRRLNAETLKRAKDIDQRCIGSLEARRRLRAERAAERKRLAAEKIRQLEASIAARQLDWPPVMTEAERQAHIAKVRHEIRVALPSDAYSL